MPKILLINPALSLEQRYGILSPAGGVEIPLGLCTLASFLKKQGVEVEIVDAQALDASDGQILMKIASWKPDYAGFTATTPQLPQAAALARKIKLQTPSTLIFIGGSHVSALPRDTLSTNNAFDVGVIGEGEESLGEAIRAFERKAPIDRVNGLIVRHHDSLVLTKARPRIKNLDTLPWPAFDLLPALDKHYYLPIQNTQGAPAISLTTSRGCAGRCSFCDRAVFGNQVTYHSAGYMVEMLAHLKKKFRIKHVMFQDDEFLLYKKRFFDFCQLLKKSRLGITWSASARVDSVDPAALKAAKESGCWQLSYGIESADQRILDYYHKNIDLQKITNALILTRQAGLYSKAFLIFGGPLETDETVLKTIDFVRRQPLDDISITFLTPYPGSQLANNTDSRSVENDFRKMTCFEPVFLSQGMTKESLLHYQRMALRQFYFRPVIWLSYLRRVRSFACFRRLIACSWHVLRYLFSRPESFRLTLSGDDFGLTEDVNAGIMAAVDRARLTSVSLMPAGDAWQDAVNLLKKNTNVDVGIHVTLVGQKTVLSPERVPSLVDKNGALPADHVAFLKAYFSGKIDRKDLEQEIGAQFEKVARAGITPSHIDSHQHLHMLPGILTIILKQAKKYNIARIRYPYTPWGLVVRLPGKKPSQFLGQLALNILCKLQEHLLRKNKLAHSCYYWNVSNAGEHLNEMINHFMQHHQSGSWELSFHPASKDAFLKTRYPEWGYHWASEHDYLMDQPWQDQLDASGALKTSFCDLTLD